MQSIIAELTDGGWVRVGPYSPYWKAPDDTGPSGRKWSEYNAHREMTARRQAKKKAPWTPRATAPDDETPAPPKRGPGRPRKIVEPAEPDG